MDFLKYYNTVSGVEERLNIVNHRYDETLKHIKQEALHFDVGVGEGYFLVRYIEKLSETFFVGLDISFSKLEKAKNLIPNSDFITGSANNLPIRKKALNISTSLETLEHLTDFKKGLEELVSKSEYIIVTVPYKERITSAYCETCGEYSFASGHLKSFSERDFKELNYVTELFRITEPLDRIDFLKRLVKKLSNKTQIKIPNQESPKMDLTMNCLHCAEEIPYEHDLIRDMIRLKDVIFNKPSHLLIKIDNS